MGSLFVFPFFANVKTFYWPMVAHDPSIYQTSRPFVFMLGK